jgi:ATP synthase protein I
VRTPDRGTAIPALSTQKQSPQQHGAQRSSTQQPSRTGSAGQSGTGQSATGQPATRRKRGWRTPSKPAGTGNEGWAIISYLIAGMLVYGGLGWLISRWTGMPAVLLPAGIVTGLVIALVMVVLRYGRS